MPLASLAVGLTTILLGGIGQPPGAVARQAESVAMSPGAATEDLLAPWAGEWRSSHFGLGNCWLEMKNDSGQSLVRTMPGLSPGREPAWSVMRPDPGNPQQFVAVREEVAMRITTTYRLLETGELEAVSHHVPHRGSRSYTKVRRWANASSIPGLVRALKGDPEERVRVCYALLAIGPAYARSGVPHLIEALEAEGLEEPWSSRVRLAALRALLWIAPDDVDAMSAIVGCLEGADDPDSFTQALRIMPRLAEPTTPPELRQRARDALLSRLARNNERLDGGRHSKEALTIATALEDLVEDDRELQQAIAPWKVIAEYEASRRREAYAALDIRILLREPPRVTFRHRSGSYNARWNMRTMTIQLGERFTCGGLEFELVDFDPGEILLETEGRPIDAVELDRLELSPEGLAIVKRELAVRAPARLRVSEAVE